MDILSDQISFRQPNSTVSLTNVRWQVIIIAHVILVLMLVSMQTFCYSAYHYGYWLWWSSYWNMQCFYPDYLTDQSDGSLQNSELSTQVMVAKLTLIDMYHEDLLLLEESVKAAETHEAISVFKQFKNPMVSNKGLCYQLSCVMSQLHTCTCFCIRLSVHLLYCLRNKPSL